MRRGRALLCIAAYQIVGRLADAMTKVIAKILPYPPLPWRVGCTHPFFSPALEDPPVTMAVLATQGHKKLGLTNASDNKQLVFVKLTDSFYEALSNYIQNQTKLQSKVRFEKV